MIDTNTPRTITEPIISPSALNAGLDCCPDWGPGIKAIDGPIVFQSLRASKDLYTGKPFVFCPWCGTRKQFK